MTEEPRRSSDPISRRRLLSYLGWGASAPALLAGGALPEWGELRLPGLASLPTALPPDDAIRLSSNENPYGMCGAARALWADAIEDANRYPFRWESQLLAALAEHHATSESHLVPGAGSTEILRMCAQAWLSPERGLVEANPTFETLGFYARSAGVPVRSIALDAEGRHDLDAMAAAIDDTTAVVYVCNPGNPSSTLVPQAELDSFLDAVPEHVIVLVDEAYHDFVDDDAYRTQIPRALASDNIIVIRTFSKVFGMAGMRVGYGIASSERIRELQAPRTEMSVSVPAAICATASIRDAAYPPAQKKLNAEARRVLTDGLDAMGIPYWASQANFVMAHLGRPMMPVNRAMAARGVQVGRLFPALPEGLRISIGTSDDMHRCVEELRRALG
jgi:histidinol-phosphate aminotransferase